jgi:menaquinone-dependent protoporphyrinogen oxidase
MRQRVLVAFASKLGSTAEIADAIGRVLAASGFDVDVRDMRNVKKAGEVDPYDAVIMGSALYAAHWQRDANRFVARYLPALQARPVWLFSSGPLDRSADTADVPMTPHVAAIVEPIGARGHRTFGGRLDADAEGIDPQVLATHPIGDFRNWPAIGAWADAIAYDLTRRSSVPGAAP